ncbi:GNAT family N-acetyltransferase [Virgibacillus ainsalahensis]
MDKIRMLQYEDYFHLEAMDTGIEDDYVKHIFDKLIQGPNRLFGLFSEGRMVSMGGYSIYAKRNVMLGRLRSDRRYKANGFASSLMTYMMHQAFQLPHIQWVGANTQEHNIPAQRVMDKIGLSRQITLHGAVTTDVSALVTGAKRWNPINDLEQKKKWVKQTFIEHAMFFPYECYYPFPGSADLFPDDNLRQWAFYENETKTRCLIIKTDQKKHHYLHAVYPWSDITSQAGLWETISNEYWKFKKQTEGETYIWMDLTKSEARLLPSEHQFELPSPWILYGMDKQKWQNIQSVQTGEALYKK